MSEVRVPVRVLPSGKVYRQMFDAEVQLVKSLNAPKATKLRLPPLRSSDEKLQEVISPGDILSQRQKSWMLGMPNDYGTENPVRYRQTATEAAARCLGSEPNVEICEVRGLSNELHTVEGYNLDIIEKIANRRKERHDIVVEQMHDDLSTITTRIEPRIKEIGQIFKEQLANDDVKIQEIFCEISNDDKLVGFSHQSLEDLWSRVERHSAKRRSWIEHADANYTQVENERLDAISGVFRKYAAVLDKIASMMPADIQRFIEKESMMANQSILANRRAYAKLRINLLESDIQREMMQHLTWHERLQDWKKLNAEITVKNFAEFMESEAICKPPEIEDLTRKYLSEQRILEEKRTEILEQLLEFMPPSSTKTSVYKWNSALAKSQENIDQLHIRWVQSLNEKYEGICQRCLSEIDKHRQNLLLSNVCSNEDMQRIVNEHMLPLVSGRQREFERNLEQMDQVFETLAIRTENQLKHLFKFVQGAAHLWDVHEIGLAKQERNLQNSLDESRQKHDLVNQESESKLDVVMDRLRQESTEESLATFLQKSLEMLEFIYSGYQDFHTEQIDIINKYPDMVKSELQRYDNTVCSFFNVDRNMPSKQISISPTFTKSPRTKQEEEEPQVEEKVKVLRDTLITDKGTSFYVVTVADKHDFEVEDGKEHDTDERKPSDAAFLTEISGAESSAMPDHITGVYIHSSTLRDYKNHIRMQFLNHLEAWSENAMAKAENSTRDKREELASEFDLRKHLHEPRAKRIELDVHNVRAAELVLHKERVSRHCKGIMAALIGLKQDFDEMTRDHDTQASNFRTEIEGMESVYINATKSAKLVELTNSLLGKLNSFMQVIKASLRHFRQTLDNTLSRLRDSNAQCLKSFKLFSQGGNFSPDETVGLRKKLEKMSQRVDAAEGVIMQDLEGMESKRMDQATAVITKFEDRFRNHMVDLTFIEKVQRWITNSQVRIKTEVQHCNGMGANVARHADLVKSRIDACKHPNPDKETISPTILREYVTEVMSCLHSRSDYLNCKLKTVEEASPQLSAQEMSEHVPQEKPSSRQSGSTPLPASRQKSRQTASRGSKLGTQKHTAPSTLAPSRTDVVTGGGTRKSHHQEDSAIGMIRSILRAQKALGAEPEDVRSVMTAGTRPLLSTAASQTGTSHTRKGSFKRQGTLSNIAGSVTDSEIGKRKDSDSRSGSGVYRRRETKFEARHMVFGTKSPHGTHFEAKIQAILYETLDGLLSTGELYYKQKGSRPVTRPLHMQDNFDQYSDAVVVKLLNYENQTKEFHNFALQQFRMQLQELEKDLAEVPNLVLQEILAKSLDNLKREQNMVREEFTTKEKNWNKIKEKHKNMLRPSLGHPDQEEMLKQLIQNEKNRQEEVMSGIEANSKLLRKTARNNTKQFVVNISQACASLLEQFDFSLTIDDVNSGQIEIKKEPTSVLIRKKEAGIDPNDTSYTPSLPRGPKIWPGLNASQLVNKGDDIAEVLEDINCTKTTLSHSSAVVKRDECLARFTEVYNSIIQDIAHQEHMGTDSENRWAENWAQSVKKVLELFE